MFTLLLGFPAASSTASRLVGVPALHVSSIGSGTTVDPRSVEPGQHRAARPTLPLLTRQAPSRQLHTADKQETARSQLPLVSPSSPSLHATQSVAVSAAASLSSPLTSVGWEGMDNSVNSAEFGCDPNVLCVEPPDPGVAVGPNDVVQTVNLDMAVYARSGTALLTVQLDSLMGLEFPEWSSDPQVAYLPGIDRWVLVLIGSDCSDGFLWLAMSDSGDPTSLWTVYKITYPGVLPDFPGLGYSSDKLVVGVNEFAIDSVDCTFSLLGTSILAVDTTDVGDGGDLAYVTTDPAYDWWNWRPAAGLSAGNDAHMLVVDPYGEFEHGILSGSVRDFPDGADPAQLTITDLSTELLPPQDVVAPEQPGGSLDIDGRVTSAVWRDARLVFVSTYPCGTDLAFDCVRVSEINTSSDTQNQDFLIGDPDNGHDDYMGGIMVTTDGTLYVVWSDSSVLSPVSTWGTYQLSSDDLNSINGWTLVRAGDGSYDGNRWGDFALLADDPTDSVSAWQGHEYPTSDGVWGTFVSRLDGPPPPCSSAPFTDVPIDHPFCPEITWMKNQGISTGYDDGTYRPDADVTRMAMSAFMARLAGATLSTCTSAPFSDVPVDHPFCPEITWMKDQGISTGYDDGTYRPGATVTRMAMSAFMARLAGATLEPCSSAAFTDVPIDHPFCPEITWMKNQGISTGYDDGAYRPGADVTRMAMSAFMWRVHWLIQ